mmetsp:Transcript_91/g.160  ORF Transcript_91/g.160 Transcript_91/m.160 type:complete len:207 (-) Transcript_91:1118-1738(-)
MESDGVERMVGEEVKCGMDMERAMTFYRFDDIAWKWLIQERHALRDFSSFDLVQDVVGFEWRSSDPMSRRPEEDYSARLMIGQFRVGSWVLGLSVRKSTEVFIESNVPQGVWRPTLAIGRFAIDLLQPHFQTEAFDLGMGRYQILQIIYTPQDGCVESKTFTLGPQELNAYSLEQVSTLCMRVRHRASGRGLKTMSQEGFLADSES